MVRVMLNMAVVAPIPSASTAIATTVKLGVLRRLRRARFSMAGILTHYESAGGQGSGIFGGRGVISDDLPLAAAGPLKDEAENSVRISPVGWRTGQVIPADHESMAVAQRTNLDV